MVHYGSKQLKNVLYRFVGIPAIIDLDQTLAPESGYIV